MLPKKAQILAYNEKALTLVPFWVAVAKASSQEGVSNLLYATAVIQIPTPPPVSKGVRVHKGKMTLRVVCLTNMAAVSKGAPLTTATKPPPNLPEDNVLGVTS